MPQPKEYYFNNLYPLQDTVLNVIAGCTADFYLTGGTALSRFYLHHRFSDDLDFFLNNVSNFRDQVDVVFSALFFYKSIHKINLSVICAEFYMQKQII